MSVSHSYVTLEPSGVMIILCCFHEVCSGTFSSNNGLEYLSNEVLQLLHMKVNWMVV